MSRCGEAPASWRTSSRCSIASPVNGAYGLGHTRWATHGRPTEENAHPHRDCTGRIVVVHNGIIENYLQLKAELEAQGHRFVTETDTEIVAHLVEREMAGDGLAAAVRRALGQLRGLFAIVLLSADDPQTLVAARNGPPIVVGLGDREFFVASDIPAILAHTRDVVFLNDGEMAIVKPSGVTFTDFEGMPREHRPTRVQWDPVMAERAGYKHFMLKEIFEQPSAVGETLVGRISPGRGVVTLDELNLSPEALRGVDRLVVLACGTSWHAGLVAKFLVEELARIPVEVDYGSEYRYRDPIVDRRTLAVVITQSGETADTLAALRESKRKGASSVAVCNVVGSMATREADGIIYTHVGPEIGVASTKGVHRSARRALSARDPPGAGARRSDARCRRRAFRRADALAAAARAGAPNGAADRGARGALLHPQRLPVSRARHALSDRARGRA